VLCVATCEAEARSRRDWEALGSNPRCRGLGSMNAGLEVVGGGRSDVGMIRRV